MMKVRTFRFVLLITLFIIVAMAAYYAFTPKSFFTRHMTKGHERNTSLLFHDTLGFSVLSSKTTVPAMPLHKTQTSRPLKEKKESLIVMANSREASELIREMHRKKDVILFTMINDAFLDFAESWCCNVAGFSDLHHRTLFLTTDQHTGTALHSLFPSLSVVSLDNQFKGSHDYSKAGYVRMMVERTRFILKLLEAGVPLLLFEVDCVWMKDPLPLLLNRKSKADILATRVSGKAVTAGGFLLLTPTRATVKFWRELTRMMNNLFTRIKGQASSTYVSEALNDQEFFSILAEKKFAGIKIEYLSEKAFPDGKWYALPPKERQESQPVIINNNWIVGTDSKRQRAKNFGHWFWDDSKQSCNSSALDNLFIGKKQKL